MSVFAPGGVGEYGHMIFQGSVYKLASVSLDVLTSDPVSDSA